MDHPDAPEKENGEDRLPKERKPFGFVYYVGKRSKVGFDSILYFWYHFFQPRSAQQFVEKLMERKVIEKLKKFPRKDNISKLELLDFFLKKLSNKGQKGLREDFTRPELQALDKLISKELFGGMIRKNATHYFWERIWNSLQ